MTLRVIEDWHVEGNDWRYDLNDGKSVVVREVLNATPPHIEQVDPLTPEQIAAIENYSGLKVK